MVDFYFRLSQNVT